MVYFWNPVVCQVGIWDLEELTGTEGTVFYCIGGMGAIGLLCALFVQFPSDDTPGKPGAGKGAAQTSSSNTPELSKALLDVAADSDMPVAVAVATAEV